jgi:hypothetical protein
MQKYTPAEIYYQELIALRKVIGTAQEWAYRHLLGFAGGPSAMRQLLPHRPLMPGAAPPPPPQRPPPAKASHLPTMGTLHKIWPKVKLTPSIEVAFRALDRYLPPNTVMTSGLRSDEDQIRIINEYYASHNGPSEITDVEQRRLWLKSDGLIIARVGSSPHRTGLAFDLSGAGIDRIEEAVEHCNDEHPELFPLKDTIIERKQNCVHVNLIK